MHKPTHDKGLNAPDHGLVTGSQAHPEIGYETTDVSVSGVVIFLVSLSAFVVVFFVFCFGMGKVINTALVKHDGPPSKWNRVAAAPHKMGKSMQSSTAIEQQQLEQMTERFPTPRLQMDDGDQDLANMHQREDLLLDHTTWVDKAQGTVRIPIEQAMEMIVAKGLPVSPTAAGTASDPEEMAAEQVTVPLTNGFARTTFEQDAMTEEDLVSRRRSGTEISEDRLDPAKTDRAKAQPAQAGAGAMTAESHAGAGGAQ